MPVNVVNSNHDFLKKIGIDQIIIDALKSHGVKLALGVNSVTFKKAESLVGHVTLPVPINKALKDEVDKAKPVVLDYVSDLLNKMEKVKDGSLTLEQLEEEVVNVASAPNLYHAAEIPKQQYAWAAKHDPIKPISPIKSPYVHLLHVGGVGGVSFLCDATEMYQRVRGTDSDNYFVVAMNDKVKIAARIKNGNYISIRAEPANGQPLFDLDVHMALAKVKLQSKKSSDFAKDYMSNHFGCGDGGATAATVLGAVLTGCELEFDTPMPNAEKLKKLSGAA